MVYCCAEAHIFYGIHLGDSYDIDKNGEDIFIESFVEKEAEGDVEVVTPIMGESMEYFLATKGTYAESNDGNIVELKKNFGGVDITEESEMLRVYKLLQEKSPSINKGRKAKWYLVSGAYSSG